MDLKAIVLDIDGTLLNDEKVITQRTKDKLMLAQKQGIKVVLASGRPTRGILPLAKELELDRYEGFLVSYNGSQVYDVKKEEILFEQALSPALANEILDFLSAWDVAPMIDIEEYMYVKDAYFDIKYELTTGAKSIVQYEVRGGNFKVCEVDNFKEIVKNPVNKILVGGNPSYLKKHFDEMQAPFKDTTTTAFSAPFYFEYTDRGVDKASALEEIFPRMGISAEDAMAFGDSQNDRSLIQYAGLGVAMGNAVPEILELADATTTTNNEEGIAVFLDRYI